MNNLNLKNLIITFFMIVLLSSCGSSSSKSKEDEKVVDTNNSKQEDIKKDKNFTIFAFDTKSYGSEPWVTDGTSEGTHLLKDINEINFKDEDSNISTTQSSLEDGVDSKFEYILMNEIYYFSANDGIHGSELWRSDGTEGGTNLVKNIWLDSDSDQFSSSPHSFVKMGNYIYFIANDGIHGSSIWKSDGTKEKTLILKNVDNMHISRLVKYNNRLYFKVITQKGEIYYESDGTKNGTVEVKGRKYRYILDEDVVDNFLVEHNSTICKLLKYNEETDRLIELKVFDTNYCDISILGHINKTLYFTFGNKLYISNGTKDGTILFKNMRVESLVNVDGVLYFVADDNIYGEELYISDGTPSGTKMVKDIYKGERGSNPKIVGNIGKKVLFVPENEGFTPVQLWISDGTDDGTKMLLSK